MAIGNHRFGKRSKWRQAVFAAGLVWLAIACIAAADPVSIPDPGRSEMAVRYLSEFEAATARAPEVLAAAAELEEYLYTQTQVEAQSGWRFFAGGDVGQYREQVTDDDMRSYQRLNVRAGLRYPLLGARNKEQEQSVRMQSEVRSKAHENKLAIRQTVLAVRMHYINYWSAQEKSQVAERFLQNRAEMDHTLRERVSTGHLRDSDRQALMSQFALVHRDLARSQALKHRALGALRFMVDDAVEPFKAAYPTVPVPCSDEQLLEASITAQHPRMLMAYDVVEDQKMLVALADRSQANGHVAVFSSVSSEFNSGEPGYGVGVNVNFDFPLKVRQAASAKRRAARAALEKAKQQMEAMRFQLWGDAREILGQYLSAKNQIAFTVQRLSAAREAVRENLLRYAYLTGDVVEQLQKSRFEYYKAAVESIDAFALRLQQQARLLSLVPVAALPSQGGGTGTAGDLDISNRATPWPGRTPDDLYAWDKSRAANPMVEERDPSRPLPRLAVYAWDSARLLDRFETNPDLMADLIDRHIDRLLVSYTRDQIDALGTRAYSERWHTLIVAAKRRGVRVDLLLGEPLWILPDHRSGLLDVVQRLTTLPFQGIHLDLEPHQLAHLGLSETYLLDQLLQSVRAVKAVSDLPLGISVHYRYLDPTRRDGGLGGDFEAIGVAEVALMIYNANPDRVVRIAEPILQHYPTVDFAIAQSVESALAPEESHATRSRSEFLGHMRHLQSVLNYPNFHTLLVQSWAEYEEMQP